MVVAVTSYAEKSSDDGDKGGGSRRKSAIRDSWEPCSPVGYFLLASVMICRVFPSTLVSVRVWLLGWMDMEKS